jgi:hypothetical protein
MSDQYSKWREVQPSKQSSLFDYTVNQSLEDCLAGLKRLAETHSTFFTPRRLDVQVELAGQAEYRFHVFRQPCRNCVPQIADGILSRTSPQSTHVTYTIGGRHIGIRLVIWLAVLSSAPLFCQAVIYKGRALPYMALTALFVAGLGLLSYLEFVIERRKFIKWLNHALQPSGS